MYRVIKTYGDCEPWWFLEGWEQDVIASQDFKEYQEALHYYQKEWSDMSARYPEWKNKTETMTAFWDPQEQLWCEECDDYLQQYHSLLILHLDHCLYKNSHIKTSKNRIRPCQVKVRDEES